ncbi:SdrD B-like domain-containing protein [Acinetobacter sp.]|uniref:SdrD B-like domain-containing protein n=1 Tax=Acinetobacter sp. TaxID=472 RepID=UPI0035AE288C
MLQSTKLQTCQKTTFVLSALTMSMLLAQYGNAAMPSANSTIQNIAYATYFVDSSGVEQTVTSNAVEINVSALYAIHLTTPIAQEIEPSQLVIWSNTLTNNSNTPARVSLDTVDITGLSNVKIYIDSNKNGQFDSSDPEFTQYILLQPGESVDLWVVATASSSLTNGQKLDLPINAVVVEDTDATASAIDSANVVIPELVATKEVQQQSFDPDNASDFDLDYTLRIQNNASKAATPIDVTIDGQTQQMVLLVDDIPANTTFKSARPTNSQAKVLYKTGANNYSTTAPTDLSTIDQLVVGFPTIAAKTTEQVDFVVTMNSGIAQTIVKNVFNVEYATTGGQKVTPSNQVSTAISGSSKIFNKSSDFSTILGSGTAERPLYIESRSATCNADRYTVDRVKIRVQSSKTGDLEEIIGVETGANTGLFRYELPTTRSDVAINQDDILQTVKRDQVAINLTDCLDANNQSTQTFDNVDTQVLMDNYGTVFDAKTGLPVAGATVTLIDATTGQPIGNNVAYRIDPVTGAMISISATQLTNSDGEFVYPHVNAGRYIIDVDTSTIPSNTEYKFTSDKSVYPISGFSSDKIVNPEWSYAGEFDIGQGETVLNIDIPIDPLSDESRSNLFVKKVATDNEAEIGDFEEYTVTVANRGNVDATDVSIKDTLPRGFIYVEGSMRVDGTKVDDPYGGKGPYLTLGLGTLKANEEVKVQYRVYIGPNALNGDGINRVRAKDSTGKESNEASAKVEVTPGAMISEGFIVGKIFTDCNRNGVQDFGEIGVPGVRVYLEDGSYAITDSEGKYDFYGISAKTHVLKVDRITLPSEAELLLISNRQAGDPNSRFVDLKRGELHRADFAISSGAAGTCSETLIDQVLKRKESIELKNSKLEQILRTDLTIDPLNFRVSDARGQPASGCISAQGISSNCAVDYSKEKLMDLKPVQFEPKKVETTVSLEKALENATDNKLEILNLREGQVLAYPQATIQIKGTAGTNQQLWVNGEQVGEKRIGKRAVLPDFQVSGLDFIGVALKPGKNTIEARQLDMMGNLRESKKIEVIAPDQLDKIVLNATAQMAQANGTDRLNVELKIVDRFGTVVSSRTPLTVQSNIGTVELEDLDKKEPGIQVFVEGGTLIVPIQSPNDAGEGILSVESGIFHASTPVRFLPNLRPIIATGIIEGAISFKDFNPSELNKVDSNDGFEEELKEISSADDGKLKTTGRAAMFLKGKVKGEYLLTLAYDSDKDNSQRLFRDIRPDEYYPVYGDSAAKGFEAQSTSKLYIRVDKGRSHVMYGDYVTRTENDEGLSLGQYNRSLTGVRGVIEGDKYKVSAFAAETNTEQVVTEQRALGISGPYSLGNVDTDDILENSEKVEILVRDRNNPGLIISTETLTRFTDYEVDTFSNSIYLKDPVPSVDANLNPMYIRITVESDQGGEEYIVGGVSGSYKITDSVKVGASHVQSDNPLNEEQLSSANTVVNLGKSGKLVAEFATSEVNVSDVNILTQINVDPSETGEISGDAYRIELDYAYKNMDFRAYHNNADEGFYNTSSPISSGRSESGIKARANINNVGLVNIEFIRTEDLNNGVNQGVSASIQRAINKILAIEFGLRYYDESEPATANTNQIAPYSGTTVRTKLTGQLPWAGSSAFIEYEQDIEESDRQVFAVGADYQINTKLRAYGRHELVSSISGLYELNDTQRRNVTVFGLESRYNNDSTAFSEYRVRDGISAREAEAAIGLRNRWELEEGFYVNAGFEQVKAVSGANNLSADNTAVSLGAEYLAPENWKAVGRIEARWADQSDTVLNNLGVAYKYSDDVTLLAKNVISFTDNKSENSGNRLVDRFQLGAAYRDTDTNRFDALTKVEYRYDKNESDLSNKFLKNVYIFSTHMNYHPTRAMTLSGQYAMKKVDTTFSGLQSDGTTYLVSGRAMYDINERWDAGIHSGLLWSDVSEGKRLLVGGEVGYLVAANLWLSGGYNFSGYDDEDLVDSDTTVKGPYLRMRFKFDENLFKRKDSSVNASREP